MNGKRAKQLRRDAAIAGLSEQTVYENRTAGVIWGSLPYLKDANKKDTDIVDSKKLNKALNKISNPKFQRVLVNAGLGATKYIRFLRYSPGIPLKMDLCQRKLYQGLKAKYLTMVS
jgi:hypothetical protein